MGKPRVRRRDIVAVGVALACMLLCCPCALALDPSLDVSQYAHKAWKTREGFTKGKITSIVQTPDGYLWLGTDFGVLRFDGFRAVPWQPPGDQHLPSSFIMSLLAARDGTLWIGTDKGLTSWNGERLTQYPELAGQFIRALLEDHDGTVWASALATPTAGKLCAIQNGSTQCRGGNGAPGVVISLYEDKRGNLWASEPTGLWRWKPGPPEFLPMRGMSTHLASLAEDFDGALLFITDERVQRLVDGDREAYPLPGSAPQFRASSVLRDRDGGLWIGTAAGLAHVHQGRTDLFSSPDGLSGDDVSKMFEDREGNIWVATLNGLDRFREFAVPTFTAKQGLSNSTVESVLAARDGSIWLTTARGLNRWNHGQFTASSRSIAQARQGKNTPYSLFQDRRGQIWAATLSEFGYLENDRFTPINGIPGGVMRSIVEDAEGSLWIANQDQGLFHLREREIVQQIPWKMLGHDDFANSLAFDSLQGGVWIGFFKGGIAYFKDGKVQASYGAADGLGEGRVTDLRFGQDGALWAATEGGLSRLKNGRFATLTTRNGLPCDTVHWMMEDDDHSFWLYTTCGLVRIVRAELDAWASTADQNKDANQTIQATVFDTFDGVASQAYISGVSPHVAKSADGKLWFPAMDGISVVNPRHLSLNKLPPPVHIEQITADHKSYDLTSHTDGSLPLPPRLRDLEIDYTALSLATWEKVLFRYKLEGWDPDWQEAGTRRRAFYTNLPPGNYHFRVMACNNSGVWNEAGASLDFFVAPAYYQTTWFRVSLLAAFLISLAALYRLRLRYVTQQVRAQMEARVEEREQIARDLHDTLLQSVQGLILKFDAIAKQIPRGEPARAAIEKTLDHADQVLAEGRDRVRHLRAYTIPFGGLPAAFQRVVEETPVGRETTFKTLVEGRVRVLHPMVREEAYCIGREALVNALTHSHGLHVEIEITYDSRLFRLRIRDDGRGFDPETLKDGGRPGHWGLQGMRERCDRIGGQLKIWSGPETGTEIELTVPGATAYQADGAKAKPKRSGFGSSSFGSSSGNNRKQP